MHSAASLIWGGDPLSTREVEVTITYFSNSDPDPFDVDNIPKPILDALKGLVYNNDSQVTDLVCRKRDRNRVLQVRNASPILLEALARPEEFLYVTVSDSQTEEVTF